MKTKDLMKLLQQCDPEEDIAFRMISGCCGDMEEMEVSDVDIVDFVTKKGKPTPKWLQIEFLPLPGYRSCMQAGGTIRADKAWLEKFGKKK